MSKKHGSRSMSHKVTGGIFGFFLSFSLAGAMICAVFLVHLLFSGLMLSMFNEDYSKSVLKYVEEQTKYYTLPTGFNPDVLKDVFELEDVEKDVKGYVEACFKNDAYVPDIYLPMQKLTENVNSSVAAEGQAISEQTTKAINQYVKDIEEIYSECIAVPGMKEFGGIRSKLVMYCCIAFAVLAAISLALVLTIRHMHHFAHRRLRSLAHAVGGAGLICTVLPLMTYLNKPYRGLNLRPEYFYNFGINLIDHMLAALVVGGVLCLIASAVLVFLAERGRKDLVTSSRRHHHAEAMA